MIVRTEAGNLPCQFSGNSLLGVGFADAWNPSTLSLLAMIVPAATAPPPSARNSAVEAMTIAGDGRILSS
ncbi:MAG TPA: hypothetical protein VMU72_06070 [Gaiellaceae bacterium]|nr:hypothetical protein [Gaiellaceae bacterium]